MEQLLRLGRGATLVAWGLMILNLVTPLPFGEYLALLLLLTLAAHLSLAAVTLVVRRQGLVATGRVLLFGLFEFYRPH
ncbi:DUF1145 domain-containing protein [Ferrimonas sediminicola]|uniref:DUF1145 domain-containing protein n=1 Tax=Ferrimonas sediminicola TaxID=2569538 RepID=A0A4U1B7M3_9GAMM|nr:DUF1145 domain-containing protein [Ferrimonas sediminicola]TKB46239.1 DUF1145 domain-containing protein [Ferrimonas sediminicola]